MEWVFASVGTYITGVLECRPATNTPTEVSDELLMLLRREASIPRFMGHEFQFKLKLINPFTAFLIY